MMDMIVMPLLPSYAPSEAVQVVDWLLGIMAQYLFQRPGDHVHIVVERTVGGWDHLLTIGHGRFRQLVRTRAIAPEPPPLFDLVPQFLGAKRVFAVLRRPHIGHAEERHLVVILER